MHLKTVLLHYKQQVYISLTLMNYYELIQFLISSKRWLSKIIDKGIDPIKQKIIRTEVDLLILTHLYV